MPASRRVGNRGRAAAAGNHRVILASARRLFAERGFAVPMNAIAREAGVGQGVLYRHFPTRLDLAFAVFEENLDELESLAADPDPAALGRVWAALLEITVNSAAFVELAVEARRQVSGWSGEHRLRTLLAAPLGRARAAGLVRADLSVDELLLLQRMIYGVIVTEVTPDAARATMTRALALIDPDLMRGSCPSERAEAPRLPRPDVDQVQPGVAAREG